jgi:oxidoreductase
VTLRVAVVGLGWAARTIWIPRLVAHPGFTLTSVVDPDPAVRAAFAGRAGADGPGPAGGPEVLASTDHLTGEHLDLAIVAVPNHAHARVAARLLRRGIPVFLEKPVCLTTAEADELAAAEQSGAALIAGSAAHYRADVQALHQLLSTLGPIRHIRLAWVRSSGVPGTDWFTRKDTAGGGALLDLGWHLLDAALPLLGPGPVTFPHVVGVVGHDFVNRHAAVAAWRADAGGPAGDARDVEDTARAFLVTGDGISVSVHASWASHAEYDTTHIDVHGGDGVAELRCTFGFSPHRGAGSTLTVQRAGRAQTVALSAEPVGAEYDRQVDALPGLVADPGQRGRAVQAARTTIGVIERVYACAQGFTAPAGSPTTEREPAWVST